MMTLTNYHSHCVFCDGRASMEDFVKFAVAKGLRAYGVSSHAPVPFANNWSMKYDDLDEYMQEFFRLREKYSEIIELYLGLEVDYIPEVASVNDPEIKRRKFDYLIGSVHHLGVLEDGVQWNIDGSFKVFKKGLDQIFHGDVFKAVKEFYAITCEMLHIGGFDIIGHFDKVALNASFIDGFSISDKWYNDLMEETLELIKEKGVIVEINTKSLARNGVTFPNFKHLKRIKERNIPVMVNSDCHYPDNVIADFGVVYDKLKECGFKSTVALLGGKWTEVPVL